MDPDVSTTTSTLLSRCNAVHWLSNWLTAAASGVLRVAGGSIRKPLDVAIINGARITLSRSRRPVRPSACCPAVPSRYASNWAAAARSVLSTHGAFSTAYG